MPFPVLYQEFKAGRRPNREPVRLALCDTIEQANRDAELARPPPFQRITAAERGRVM